MVAACQRPLWTTAHEQVREFEALPVTALRFAGDSLSWVLDPIMVQQVPAPPRHGRELTFPGWGRPRRARPSRKAGAEMDWWRLEHRSQAKTILYPTRTYQESAYRGGRLQGPSLQGRPGLRFMAQRGLVATVRVAERQHRA